MLLLVRFFNFGDFLKFPSIHDEELANVDEELLILI